MAVCAEPALPHELRIKQDSLKRKIAGGRLLHEDTQSTNFMVKSSHRPASHSLEHGNSRAYRAPSSQVTEYSFRIQKHSRN